MVKFILCCLALMWVIAIILVCALAMSFIGHVIKNNRRRKRGRR